MRGRRRVYHKPFVVTLKCEHDLHDMAVYLGLSDTEIYHRGIIEIMNERSSELSVKHQQQLIQLDRLKLKEIQDKIAWRERVLMDTEIKNEQETRKKKEVRYDERGKAYQVVIAE